MSEILGGVIRGRTIELEAESGIEDGQRVRIFLAAQPAVVSVDATPTGIKGSAGLLAGYPDLDATLNEVLADRKRESFRETPE